MRGICIQKIGTVNLRDTRQVKQKIDTLQQEIYELSTYLCLWIRFKLLLISMILGQLR